ncbi:MAG TPA: hypothetical protein VJK48_05910 [Chlamydiales bacterium]|nr:hypothetical protein [Chlamydiales bacterium]
MTSSPKVHLGALSDPIDLGHHTAGEDFLTESCKAIGSFVASFFGNGSVAKTECVGLTASESSRQLRLGGTGSAFIIRTQSTESSAWAECEQYDQALDKHNKHRGNNSRQRVSTIAWIALGIFNFLATACSIVYRGAQWIGQCVPSCSTPKADEQQRMTPDQVVAGLDADLKSPDAQKAMKQTFVQLSSNVSWESNDEDDSSKVVDENKINKDVIGRDFESNPTFILNGKKINLNSKKTEYIGSEVRQNCAAVFRTNYWDATAYNKVINEFSGQIAMAATTQVNAMWMEMAGEGSCVRDANSKNSLEMTITGDIAEITLNKSNVVLDMGTSSNQKIGCSLNVVARFDNQGELISYEAELKRAEANDRSWSLAGKESPLTVTDLDTLEMSI